MAEAFAILSVEANIAQFAEYALVIVSESREILASARGVTQANLEIEAIISSISARHEALVKSTSSHAVNKPSSRGELAILSLVERCGPISKDIVKILEKLKAKNPSFPKLESLRAALVASTKKSTIHDLKQRLLAIEDEIGREMINILNDKQSQIITKIDRLEELHGLNDLKTSTRLAALLEELKDDASRLSFEQIERSDQALNQVLASINRLSEQAAVVEWEHRLLDSLSFEELRERKQHQEGP